MSSTETPLAKLVDRVGSLYTLPAVAMEVVRLTSQESVDPRVIKETIEGDPALTAKILRVVNSSMFGLSSEVGNLTQALALLGVRPLKLLVLGFSLPDRLFADLAAEELEQYWTTALTRAVAARTIANSWFETRGGRLVTAEPPSGDDAFVAGLLRDLGLLVLMQEVGEPYLQFRRTTAGPTPLAAADRRRLERESLGFDHLGLTAALLRAWRLPAPLINAVATTAPSEDATTLEDAPAPSSLAEVLVLADLATQLVVDRRLDALGELLALGDAWCGLTRPQLNTVIESLESRVRALADALRAPIREVDDYAQTLTDAHAQQSLLATSSCQESPDDGPGADQVSELLLAESHELRLAMRSFLAGAPAPDFEQESPEPKRHARTEPAHQPGADPLRVELNAAAERRLEQAVDKLAERCRHERLDLSLAMIGVEGLPIETGDRRTQRCVANACEAAADALASGRAAQLTLSDGLLAVLLPGVDRRSAIGFCQAFAAELAEQATRLTTDERPEPPAITLDSGVASIVAVPNRFEGRRLIEGATRCLLAAQTTAGASLKSIEVY